MFMTSKNTSSHIFKWFVIVFALIGLIVLGALINSGNAKNLSVSTDDFFSNSDNQASLQLADFPIHTQEFANSCGPATISMLYSWLVNPISEAQLTEQSNRIPGQKGMFPVEFAKALQQALTSQGFTLQHLKNVPDDQMLQAIYAQLQAGLPVPIYFSTQNAWNLPNYDTHYSVITGINPAERSLTIANAYGFEENISIDDFLLSTKYDNFENPPFEFLLGRFFGVIKRNNLYLLSKQ